MAQTDCPYGRIDDPYPGLCELYTDENNNQTCDLSEPELSSFSYQVFWFLFIPAALYFLHWYLANKTNLGKKNWIFSKPGFKYSWNIVLLLLFIPAGIFGLLSYLGVKTNFLFNWHNNFGASFVVISLIHIVARLDYYLKRFKKSK